VGTGQGKEAGRSRRALSSRVSTGHVVMVLAGALGVLLTLTILRASDDTRPVLVAAHDLAPGTVLTDATVRVAHVHADASVLATLFTADDLPSLHGEVVTTLVHQGALIARGSVSSLDAHVSTREMSFSIARARAVGGKLTTGDRVDVLAVAHESGHAGYVVTDAEVVAVDSRGGGALSGASDDVTVTLVVEPATAPQLAAAVDAGTVMLVRTTGAPVARNVTPYVTGAGK
jgi:Flp pilus assembly protein CpaB